jgi:hypothetical protein
MDPQHWYQLMSLVYVRVCTVRKWLLMEKGRNLSFSCRRNDSFFIKVFIQCTVLYRREKHRSYLHSWYSDTNPWAQVQSQYIDLRSWGWWGWGRGVWVVGGCLTIRPSDAGFRTIGSIKIAASSHQCILKSWKGPPFYEWLMKCPWRRLVPRPRLLEVKYILHGTPAA